MGFWHAVWFVNCVYVRAYVLVDVFWDELSRRIRRLSVEEVVEGDLWEDKWIKCEGTFRIRKKWVHSVLTP
jgi:hypothetical protein